MQTAPRLPDHPHERQPCVLVQSHPKCGSNRVLGLFDRRTALQATIAGAWQGPGCRLLIGGVEAGQELAPVVHLPGGASGRGVVCRTMFRLSLKPADAVLGSSTAWDIAACHNSIEPGQRNLTASQRDTGGPGTPSKHNCHDMCSLHLTYGCENATWAHGRGGQQSGSPPTTQRSTALRCPPAMAPPSPH